MSREELRGLLSMLVLFCLLVRLVHLPCRPCMRIRRLNRLAVYGGARRWDNGGKGAYPAYSLIFHCLDFTRYGRVFPHSGVLTGHACRITLERDYLSVLLNHRRTSLLFLLSGSSSTPSLCIGSGLVFDPSEHSHRTTCSTPSSFKGGWPRGH